jgi:hypothetical protein
MADIFGSASISSETGEVRGPTQGPGIGGPAVARVSNETGTVRVGNEAFGPAPAPDAMDHLVDSFWRERMATPDGPARAALDLEWNRRWRAFARRQETAPAEAPGANTAPLESRHDSTPAAASADGVDADFPVSVAITDVLPGIRDADLPMLERDDGTRVPLRASLAVLAQEGIIPLDELNRAFGQPLPRAQAPEVVRRQVSAETVAQAERVRNALEELRPEMYRAFFTPDGRLREKYCSRPVVESLAHFAKYVGAA